ncbi:hypothetical protein [Bacillus cereus]|nr:hypothetical protein [Bacillus cereus]
MKVTWRSPLTSHAKGMWANLQVVTYSERRRSLVTRNSGGGDGL